MFYPGACGKQPMDEFVCVTVLSKPGEGEPGFSARLSRFWTHMLRSRQGDFEKVYAEATAFEARGDRVSRQYLVEAGVTGVLEAELRAAGVDYEPIDSGELYSRYEATPPDWMQIEH